MSGDIAVGTPMFSRVSALRNLMTSLPAYVSTVYVADNGHTEEHQHLYTDDWPFAVEVLDIQYDSGIGACRAALCDAVTEPYLFMCDSDMELQRSTDLRVLREVLTRKEDLGGVAAWLHEGSTIRTGARNLHVSDTTLIKTVREQPEVAHEPYTHARFEFVPQCVLYRTDIFADYAYDESIFNSEHIDFFIGHKEQTEWQFASTPAVVVKHHQNIDPEYRESKRGSNRVDWERLEEKWGYTYAVPGARPDWMFTRERSLGEHTFDVFRRATPPRIWIPVRQAVSKFL